MSSFFRFCLIGILSTTINYTTYLILLCNELSIFLGSGLGYACGTFISYHFGRTWVFNQKFKSDGGAFIKFVCIYTINGLIVASITTFLSKEIGFNYNLSWLMGITYGMFANFLGAKFIVFKK